MLSATQKRVLAALSGIAVCLLCAELALRAFSGLYAWRQQRANRSAALQKGSYRILCIGESTTMNQYPALLEKELNSRGGGIKFSVIDKGVIGISSDGILAALPDNLEAYNPDMVIAMLGENDSGPLVEYERLPSRGPLSSMLESSAVYRAVVFLRRLASPAPSSARAPFFLFPVADAFAGIIEEETDALMARADDLKRRGDYPGAIEIYNKVMAGGLPEAETAYIELARMKVRKLDFDGAWQILQKGLAWRKTPLLYTEAAMVADQQGRHHDALNLLSSAQRVGDKLSGKDRAWILNEIAQVYRHLQKPALSQQYFSQAVSAEPGNWYRYRSLSEALALDGKNEEAREVLRQALARLGEVPELYAALASLSGDKKMAEKAVSMRSEMFNSLTGANYRRIRDMVLAQGRRLVCSQYPLRELEPLRRMLGGANGIIYVDNGPSFRAAVAREGYDAYFIDRFGGDFGHCTAKGNALLTRNIAAAILASF